MLNEGDFERSQAEVSRLSASASSFRPKSTSSSSPRPDSYDFGKSQGSPSSSPASRLRADSRPFNPRGLPDSPSGLVMNAGENSTPSSLSSSLVLNAPDVTTTGLPDSMQNAQSAMSADSDIASNRDSAGQSKPNPMSESQAPHIAESGSKTQKATKPNRVPAYRNPDRHTSGGSIPPSSKLTPEELTERMARIRLQNEEIMKRAAEIANDKESFEQTTLAEKQRLERELREKRERDRLIQRKVEEERRKIREKKVSRKESREWDAMKNGVQGQDSCNVARPAAPARGTLDWSEE